VYFKFIIVCKFRYMEFINRLRNAGFPEDEDIADEKLNDAVDLAVEGGVYAWCVLMRW
jgi:hypothetical protein